MRQNSFQKNGLLRINDINSQANASQSFGRRTVQEIRDDMFAAKTRRNAPIMHSEQGNPNWFSKSQPDLNNRNNHRQNVENLRNLNKWK